MAKKTDNNKPDIDNLISELQKVFASLSDGEREVLHDKLMTGYCKTCAHKMEGETCWGCFESHYDA